MLILQDLKISEWQCQPLDYVFDGVADDPGMQAGRATVVNHEHVEG